MIHLLCVNGDQVVQFRFLIMSWLLSLQTRMNCEQTKLIYLNTCRTTDNYDDDKFGLLNPSYCEHDSGMRFRGIVCNRKSMCDLIRRIPEQVYGFKLKTNQILWQDVWSDTHKTWTKIELSFLSLLSDLHWHVIFEKYRGHRMAEYWNEHGNIKCKIQFLQLSYDVGKKRLAQHQPISPARKIPTTK